jgi:hypothetical protein
MEKNQVQFAGPPAAAFFGQLLENVDRLSRRAN